MRRLLISLLAALVVLVLSNQVVSAHVLVKDATDQYGAVVHVNPDDDPEAGSPSTTFFDLQQLPESLKSQSPMVIVTDEDDRLVQITYQQTANGLQISATYPRRGLYKVTVRYGDVTFTFSQRVSRGVVGSHQPPAAPLWADIGVLASGLGLSILLIVVFNRRLAIKAYSKW